MSQPQKSLREIIQDEFKKCAVDPAHFMKKYCVIQHPTKGKTYFHLYPFQEDVLHTIRDSRYTIILKSRQLGISTLTAGYVLWSMLFKSDFNVLVIATTKDVAKNLVTKIQVMHDNLPKWLQGKLEENNKLSLRFANGSQVKAVSSAGTSGRSEALSLLVMDECCDYNTEITVRNKLTGISETISIGDFYNRLENISYYEILTPSGYSNFAGISRKEVDIMFHITFSDASFIRCTENHLLKITPNDFLEACHLEVGDELEGGKVISDITYETGSFLVFDPINVELNNEYYSNGIISHNCAFIRNIDEIWTAAQQTLATGGGCIALSTPNGTGNWFHKTWVEARSNGLFTPVELHWKVHPDRDETWRQEQNELLGVKEAAQECVAGDTIVTIRNTVTGIIESVAIDELRLKQNNNIYEVLTPTGFQLFDGILESTHTKYLNITIGDNILKCSLNHIIVNEGNNVLASDIKLGDIINGSPVTNYELIEDDIKMYDLANVHNGHLYLTNNIISHNCDCDFISSGHTVIDGNLLQWYKETYVKDPIERRGFDGNYWIWDYPNYSKKYTVVADVARGDGGDYSAFHVIDIESVRQVAEYRGKIGTTEYGNMLLAVATEYNNALLVVENANVGWAVLQVLIDRNYSNLYYSYRNDAYIDENIHLMKGYDLKNKSQMVPGFSTTSKTRPLLISKLETYFREKSLVIHSTRTIDELFTFIWNGARAEADRGYNDDLTMSLGISLWIRDTALRLQQQGLDLSRKALGHFGKTDTSVYSTKSSSPGWSWSTGNGPQEDLGWLL